MRRRTLIASAGLLWAGAAPAALPDVIAAVRPSVLPIGRFDPLASPRFAFRGTAFVVGDGRHVVTNAHVLAADAAGAASAASAGLPPQWALQRPLPDGGAEWRRLERVASDPEHDLALLRMEGAPLPALTLGADDGVREGQAVALVGFPIAGVLGFQTVTHRGIVSSIAAIRLPAPNMARLNAGAVAQLRRGTFDIFQLDATAYPGNSGGPVLDAATGEVVAVVNMVLAKGGREGALSNPTGISYAIPVRWVRALLAAQGVPAR